MPPVGYEPTIPAGERLQTYALDRAATETSRSMNDSKLMIVLSVVCLAVCVCVCVPVGAECVCRKRVRVYVIF